MDYKEKLRLAKEALDSGSYDKETIEYIFPELCESEDERIRQLLIRFVAYDMSDNYSDDFTPADCVAWLEKQGKNNMGISEATKKKLEDSLKQALEKETSESCNEFLEKQGEQNLIKHFCDCVHVGCHVNDCKRWCHSYQKEISYTNCNSNCNRYSKLMNHAFNIGETITDGISTFKIADIKDNYYIANDGERVEIYMAHRYYTTIQNLEVQKLAWGEEDIDIICKAIFDYDKIDMIKTKQLIDFLKSIKDRYTWKPSEEQLKALKEAVDEHFDIDGGALWHLYEDLKKLKE